MTSTNEQNDLTHLKRTFERVAELASRTQSRERMLRPAPGSELAEDDRLSNPFQVSHAVASALTVAVDHLEALRRMTAGCAACEPEAMYFSMSAHWALLRAALENAARAVWVVGPADRAERVTRALRLQAANVINSDAAERVISRSTGSAQRRPKAERIARVKDIAANAGLSRGKAVEPVGYGGIVQYAGDYVNRDADRLEFLWRACSGAAHGDTWAVLSLQDREALDPADGVVTMHLAVSVRLLSLVADDVVDLVETAFELVDHRNQPPA